MNELLRWLEGWVPAALLDDNSIHRVAVALVVAAVVYLALRLLRRLAKRRLRRLAESTVTRVDDLVVDLLERTGQIFALATALFAGAEVLALPEDQEGIVRRLYLLVACFQLGIWGTHALTFTLRERLRTAGSSRRSEEALLQVTNYLGRLILWSLVVLLFLDNLGIDITALVAGVSVGGLAISLALTSVLKDTFASLSIVFDRPFDVGDFISLGAESGTVERIGMKTTRLRSVNGEQLVIGNDDLLSSRIQNFERMGERRCLFRVGVEYGTPARKLEQVVDWLKELVEAEERARWDRGHLRELADSAVEFEFVYWILSAEYAEFLDIHQRLCLALYRRFEEEGVAFAFPTQTVHVEGLDPRSTGTS